MHISELLGTLTTFATKYPAATVEYFNVSFQDGKTQYNVGNYERPMVAAAVVATTAVEGETTGKDKVVVPVETKESAAVKEGPKEVERKKRRTAAEIAADKAKETPVETKKTDDDDFLGDGEPAATPTRIVTKDDVRAALMDAKARTDGDTARKVLTALGAATVGDLKEEQYAEAERLAKAVKK
jgi:hypothetical protein